MSPRRRLLVGCGLALALLLLCFAFNWSWGREILYRRSLRRAFEGEIEYLEYQPNTDWPKCRIAEPDRLAAVQTWLLSSNESSAVRSAPPAPVCEMRFVFNDGRVETIQHSPFRERLSNEGWLDVRDDVRFFFRGHDRTGCASRLAAILDAD
jgi:hypothetical protein